MPARNKPAHLHLLEGTFRKARHSKRPPEPVEELGLAPTHLPVPARAVWQEVSKAAPWLRKADAHLVELFARLVAEQRADYDTMPTSRLAVLANVASKLALTATDRAKLSTGKPESADADSEFFT